MELIRGSHNLRERHRGCAVTIGNFDGVHKGHQAILARLVARARELGVKSTVMIFEPQPVEFFAPDKAPARITPLRDKVRALAACGIDQILCLPFNKALSSLSADDFIRTLLVDGLDTQYLVVGDDFRFGRGREGDIHLLRQAGQMHNFAVVDTPTVEAQGERISSTRIRAALKDNRLKDAAELLGHRYCINGRVRYGDQLGRTIGCPTINQALDAKRAAVAGVYVVQVSGGGLSCWPGVASCGTRPTVNGQDNRLETYLLDYDGNLYGQYLTVEFLQFLRPEEKFDDLETMKAAIDDDIAAARQFFESTS